MSDAARHWSRWLRGGFLMSEHSVARELGEYHVAETNLCFPKIETIASNYECTRDAIKKIMSRLENWQLITREETFRVEGGQTSNRYTLHLDRHFPNPFPEGRRVRDKNPKQIMRPYDHRDHAALVGAEKGFRLLRLIKHVLSHDQTLAMGIKEAFVEAQFKKGSRIDDILWLAIESETHETRFTPHQKEIEARIHKDATIPHRHPFKIQILRLFDRKKQRSTDHLSA